MAQRMVKMMIYARSAGKRKCQSVSQYKNAYCLGYVNMSQPKQLTRHAHNIYIYSHSNFWPCRGGSSMVNKSMSRSMQLNQHGRNMRRRKTWHFS